MSDAARWPAPWVRAALETAVLACLSDRALHGYALGVHLSERGFGRPRGGSLYPVLARLEADGSVTARWVTAQSGPGRKEYAITAVGYQRLAQQVTDLQALATALGPVHPPRDTAVQPVPAHPRNRS